MNTEQKEDEMHRDPNNWKWGLFYYNPNDERLFVPKKIQVFGLTLNFADPRSHLILLSLAALLAIAIKIG